MIFMSICKPNHWYARNLLNFYLAVVAVAVGEKWGLRYYEWAPIDHNILSTQNIDRCLNEHLAAQMPHAIDITIRSI